MTTSSLQYLPKRKENIHPHKDLYVNIHSDFIYNSPKLETTQISKNRKRIKQIVIYLYDTQATISRNEWLLLHATVQINSTHSMLNKRNQIHEHMQVMLLIWSSGTDKTNLWRTKSEWCLWPARGERQDWRWRSKNGNILYLGNSASYMNMCFCENTELKHLWAVHFTIWRRYPNKII